MERKLVRRVLLATLFAGGLACAGESINVSGSGGSAPGPGSGGSPTTSGSGGRAEGSGGAPGSGGRVAGSGGNEATGGSGTGGAPGTGGGAGGRGASGGGAQCTLPWAPNNGTGTFTWYFFGQGSFKDNLGFRTACGYIGQEPSGMGSDTVANIVNPQFFAAVPGSNNFNTVDHCGACAQVSNGAKSVVVTIVDECPTDNGQNPPCAQNPNGHLDLSTAVFDQLGYSRGDPTGTTWKFVPCPVTGNVVLQIKNGNQNEFFIQNTILAVKSVMRGGENATHQSYGAWHFGGNLNSGDTLTVTDAASRTITISVKSTQMGQNQDTGVQFPACQ